MPVPRPSYPMIAARQIEMLARESGIPTELVPSVSKLFRRVLDKQAIDERLNYQWIADNMGGGGGGPYAASVFVASSYASDAEKAGADFVCDGIADDVEINAAIQYLRNEHPWGGGVVHLSAGIFTLANTIDLTGHDGSLSGVTANRFHQTQVETEWGGSFTGTWMVEGGTHTAIRNLQIYSNHSGVGVLYLANGLLNEVEHCYVETVDSNDLTIDIGSGVVLDCWIRGTVRLDGDSFFAVNYLENGGDVTSNGGIRLIGGAHVIVNNELYGHETSATAIDTENTSGPWDGPIISNNFISGWGFHGIRLAHYRDAVVIGNQISRVGQRTHNTYDGIFLDTNVDTSIISANRVLRSTGAKQARYGINNANANNDRNLIRDNHLYLSGATGSFNDAGTNTNIVDANGNYV